MGGKAIPKHLTVKEILLRYRKIDPITGCWLWTLSTDVYGYGQLRINGKTCKVHRLSYELFIGPLKEGCLHKRNCINHNCFNPDHLYDGDQFDNLNDIYSIKGHHNSNKKYCLKGHEFNYINPTSGSRVCTICRNEYLKNYRNKHKKVTK